MVVGIAAIIAGGCGRATVERAVPGTAGEVTTEPATRLPGDEAPDDTAAGSTVDTEDGIGQPSATQPSEQQVAPPIGVRIPAIGVEAITLPLGLRADGTIDVPSDFATTGWWVDGPEPGEPGPAVILGHVDSRAGPAVFFELRTLEPGDEILVDRADGSVITYIVERLEKHSKESFPTDAVYGSTDEPVLRLITCGGEFDRSVRSYEDNVIVFAALA